MTETSETYELSTPPVDIKPRLKGMRSEVITDRALLIELENESARLSADSLLRDITGELLATVPAIVASVNSRPAAQQVSAASAQVLATIRAYRRRLPVKGCERL